MVVDMVTHELSPGITAISFTGGLVVGNRLTDVEHAIGERIKQGCRKLVLDFSGLTSMDSAGVGVLAMWVAIMQREGGKLAVAGATGPVEQVLDRTHLNRYVGMYANVASAYSAMAELPPVPRP
jgi:stage II sporulation protein AA (anti-sigma F factor antagonist)